MTALARTSLGEALSLIAGHPDQRRYAFPLHHGTMRAGVYAPRGTDPQQPHGQDELYIIIAGSGRLMVDGVQSDCTSGDVLFVGAGCDHRFENFTDDLMAWVIFWGPEGGEQDD